MAKEIPCGSTECPKRGPDGKWSYSTVQATVGETQQSVNIQKHDLLLAAGGVRTQAALSRLGIGERARDQFRTVPATTMDGQAVHATVNGATLTSEARQGRLMQAGDVFQAVRNVGKGVPRPFRA